MGRSAGLVSGFQLLGGLVSGFDPCCHAGRRANRPKGAFLTQIQIKVVPIGQKFLDCDWRTVQLRAKLLEAFFFLLFNFVFCQFYLILQQWTSKTGAETLFYDGDQWKVTNPLVNLPLCSFSL